MAKQFSPARRAIRAAARRAAAEFAKWTRWAETHCWKCDAEVGEYSDGDKCPECGADLIPF